LLGAQFDERFFAGRCGAVGANPRGGIGSAFTFPNAEVVRSFSYQGRLKNRGAGRARFVIAQAGDNSRKFS
jgi:hypothetical protein